MIDHNGILVLVVILFILVSLYFEIVGPGFTFVIALAILATFKVITPAELLSGFANEQIMNIIMLLLIGDVFRRTSVLDIFFDKFFKHAKSPRHFTFRMMIVVAPLSAFLNNTPLVAILIPYIHNWGIKNRTHVSKLLMPLSFAAILGGSATLIGTSTNMIVNGLVVDQQIVPNLKPLEIFDFVYVGVPMIVIGILYMLFIGIKLLPKIELPALERENSRDYIFELQIKEGSDFVGVSRSKVPFLKNEGFILIEVFRNGVFYHQIDKNYIFEAEDILIFAGNKEGIADLVNADKRCVIPSVGMFARKHQSDIVEIVISHKSGMIGKRIMHENFRGKYDGTVIAIHRNGENIIGHIANAELRAGDALLLMVGNQFKRLSKTANDFYVISKIKEIRRLGVLKTTALIGGMLLVIALNLLGMSTLFTGLLVFLIVTQLLKIVSPKDLAQSVDYQLALIIALSLALGMAMIKTGVADMLANGVLFVFKPLGKYGLLFGIYLITSLMAAFITNKAAVAIAFPISLSVALNLGVDTTPFVLVVAFAAAANFMTPIGYQTNLMIYGPGGYKFKDFLRVGTPLTIIYMITTVVILSFLYL
ncbi:MAG: anion permease [Bacteroidales bacterium]|nr:anion permease [Bacteroidales bacterium]MBN2755659.1 anion permease [Bacteroidales bacterium]